MILRWLLFIGCILLALGSVPASAKKSDGPEIKDTKFENKPKNLFYFEDTDTIVFQDSAANSAFISYDAGEKWEAIDVDNDMSGRVLAIWPHPFDKEKAYVLGGAGKHWVTGDAGKSWKSFKIEAIPSAIRAPLAFHGRDTDKVIFHGEVCEAFECAEQTYYTTDNFRTVNKLSDQSRGCSWAVGNPGFGEDSGKSVEDRMFCVVRGQHSSQPKDFRLLYSDNYFQDGSGTEPGLDGGHTVRGVINTATVKKFLIAAAKAEGTDELALYVSVDGDEWHRAEFGGHRLEEEAYTVLESTNYSIQVDVLTTKQSSAMGVLFTSNSNGTYFTRNIEHTNRDLRGTVDFEKIAGIQGIVLVNTVSNWEEVEKTSADKKKIVSKISFDDGRTFQSLKVDDKDLHLHSVSTYANSGRVFSSPAPGLVMGVGNTGNHLKDYEDGDLYVSDDAGLTWRRGLKDAHKYEFGDQGAVIVAINDEGRTDKISYSINHGKDWETAKLPQKIRANLLTTTPDSTSLKFLLVGSVGGDLGHEHYVMSIDFNDLHERKCKDSDFEKWPARLGEDGEPDCLMGHKQFYRRRKADADCFVDKEFKDPVPEFKQCECSKKDFECDYNFVRSEDRKECLPAGPLAVPDGACKNPEDTYKGPSGFRLIPGNECSGGEKLDKEEVERSCSDVKHKNPTSGEISAEKSFFPASKFKEYYYLERKETNKGEDETVIMRTDQNIYMSSDHGKNWKEILKDKGVVGIFPHPHLSDTAYFLTGTKKGFWTIDRAQTFHGFEAPLPPSRDPRTPPLAFHSDNKNLMIWAGSADCDSLTGDCHAVAYYTKNRGDSWELLLRYVRKCEFIQRDGRNVNDKLIFCEQYENENLHNPRQLVGSDNWFEDKTVHFDNIEAFATMSEFIIVAAHSQDDDSLKLDASVDGETFADAEFPPNFHVPVQQAYTVLDSSTHSVSLHVTVSNVEDHEYGTILRSNSNGTSYVVSLNAVNRNYDGYVDFEKTQGLEGIAIVNIVGNVEESDAGKMKQLKTMITHNDGAQWSLLPPPEKDIDGKSFGCSTKGGKPTDDCSLHLHGYTERKDPRDTFSSPSAIGIMLGVGNVGEYLSLKSEGNTFMTRDGGISWTMVKKGSYMWEYGNQGSIIVIVEESTPTKVLYYTLDEGKSWEEYKFSDTDMQIDDISTVPSDTSRNFLLWGREVGSGSKKGIATVNLDFTGLRERECKWDKDISKTDDYYLWEPKHPMQDDQNCLFGHISQYYRKEPTADCYNGQSIKDYNITQNCDCTRQDYECDYNYEPQKDGSCALVPGLKPADPKQTCYDDPDAIEYYEPTGYRLIPLSTCTNGLQLNHFEAFPCPDKEKEFEEKHPRLGGAGLFFAIVLPIAAAACIGYYAYTKWGKDFGRIRLGDGTFGGSGRGGSWLSKDSPLVTVPVMVIAGAFAVASALPLLAMSLWRSVRGYMPLSSSSRRSRFGGRGSQRPYASRGAFAARRGDYVGVVDDEDELLGGEDFSGDEDDEV
ncbi:vacuolar protein sorting/targeting protein PEP1 [Arachnomyces sp. PD_36]|nr:vacuolar protein sorting/targeting protein PEP1 [Arachnomyces sp. PD_36]